MTEAPVGLLRGKHRKQAAAPRVACPPVPSSEGNHPVEVVTHDEYCADLLIHFAAQLFPAEIVSGPGWIVRLQPPPSGERWVLELVALVERWLESIPLPCAKLLYDGHSYLIRPSINDTHARVPMQLASIHVY